MLILPYLIQPIILGFIAQRAFGRFGIIWAIFAFLLSIILAILLDHSITSQPRWMLDPEYRRSTDTIGHQIAFLLMSIGTSSVVTLIVLATLPKRKGKISKSTQDGRSPTSLSRVEELERLGRLKDQNILTEEEFQTEKRKVLGNSST